MQKSVSGLTIFLLLALNCFGQNNNEMIVFSAGPSFPLGSFGSRNIGNSPSPFARPITGFAKPGESAAISYYSKRKGQFGFTMAVQADRNPLNTKKLEKAFSQAKFYQGIGVGPSLPPPPPTSYKTYPNWKFDKHAWLTASLLAGGYGEFATHHSSLSFITNAMMGFILASSPKLNGNSITDTVTARYEQSSKKGIGFTWLLGGGIKYSASKKVWIYGQLEYTGSSTIKFKKIRTTVTTTHSSSGVVDGISQSVTTADGKQAINAIHFRIGIGMRL